MSPKFPSPTLLRWLAASTLALGCSGPLLAQVVVVVNPKSNVSALTPEQVANLFLGKTPGTIIDLAESSPVRDQFYNKATGKTASQVKAVWSRLTFSGKATPPKELPTAAEVKKFIAANPDAVGYVEKAAADNSVKVVLELN